MVVNPALANLWSTPYEANPMATAAPMANVDQGSYGFETKAQRLLVFDALEDLLGGFCGADPAPCAAPQAGACQPATCPPPATQGNGCGSCAPSSPAAPATPAPASPNGTVTQPSEHYSLGSDLSGPVNQSTTFTQGPGGTVLENTRYTDNSGHWYADQGVWNPATGVLTNNETNDQGQHANVNTSVVNGQIVSNVTGDGNVQQCVVSFQDPQHSTETLINKDGTTQTEQVAGSNGGPWGTYQMSTPDTVVQQNFGDGNPTTTTENLTFPAASTVSTWV